MDLRSMIMSQVPYAFASSEMEVAFCNAKGSLCARHSCVVSALFFLALIVDSAVMLLRSGAWKQGDGFYYDRVCALIFAGIMLGSTLYISSQQGVKHTEIVLLLVEFASCIIMCVIDPNRMHALRGNAGSWTIQSLVSNRQYFCLVLLLMVGFLCLCPVRTSRSWVLPIFVSSMY